MPDELDQLSDTDLRLRALPLLGIERLTDDERQSWRVGHGTDVAWRESVSGERPYHRLLSDGQAPDPATDANAAVSLVEAVMVARRRERMELEPPRADGDGWEARFTYYDCDGRNVEEYATAPTLPRVLTLLALRVPRI